MSKTLRADITGLRAIAVLAVTLFHITHVFNSEGTAFSGGFLGVDIFFVISGYLMTMIIVSGIEKSSFSLWDFYKRRAKRICPALFAVTTLTLIFCLVLFRPDPIHESFKEGLAALGFVSNFRFAKDLDYFDGGDFSHLFLHTWSLSVEWQFYIFYPLILICLKRLFGVRSLAPLMLLLTIVCVVIAVCWTNINARQSYFLLPSRACELLFGSLAYFYPIEKILKSVLNKNNQNLDKLPAAASLYAEIIGLILIVLSFVLIDDRNGWPTAWLLLPMVGTWLCIAANNTKSVLRGSFFQKIGLWSYSIYLVHWPILVFAHALGLAQYSFIWLVPIFLFGFLLHVCIEKKRGYGVRFCVIYILVAVVFLLIDKYRIYDNLSISPISKYGELASRDIFNNNVVQIGDSPKFILHGDSLSVELVKSLIERKISFIFNNQDGCYSVGSHFKNFFIEKRSSEHRRNCKLLYSKTKALSEKYSNLPVVFVNAWSSFGDSESIDSRKNIIPFFNIYDDLTKIDAYKYDEILSNDLLTVAEDFSNKTVYIVGMKQVHPFRASGRSVNYGLVNSSVISFFNLNGSSIQKSTQVNYHSNDIIHLTIKNINQRKLTDNSLADVRYIDPDVYCNEGECDLFVNSVIPIYADGTHYSWAGSERSVTNLLNHLGIDAGQERTDFTELPEIDFKSKQTVLEYSPETAFNLPDSH